jgi:hypothetical protein
LDQQRAIGIDFFPEADELSAWLQYPAGDTTLLRPLAGSPTGQGPVYSSPDCIETDCVPDITLSASRYVVDILVEPMDTSLDASTEAAWLPGLAEAGWLKQFVTPTDQGTAIPLFYACVCASLLSRLVRLLAYIRGDWGENENQLGLHACKRISDSAFGVRRFSGVG